MQIYSDLIHRLPFPFPLPSTDSFQRATRMCTDAISNENFRSIPYAKENNNFPGKQNQAVTRRTLIPPLHVMSEDLLP